jgi:V/A-type H+-transporting ATPase subunit B
MNAIVRLYSGDQDAEKKQAMAFESSSFDHKLLRFGGLFRERFMNIEVSMSFDDALDLAWRTMAECFEPEELLFKQSILDKCFPESVPAQA